MIKAVFFDVDGTLLSQKQGKVPISTRRALRRIRKKGIKIFIATGRHMIELSKLPVMEIPFDGYLTLNGNLILDENKKAYAGTPISADEVEVLSGIFRAKKIPFVMISSDKRYINYVDDVVVETQASTHGTIPDVGTVSDYDGEKIYQCIAFVQDHERKVLDEILDECSITSWNPTGIDIVARGSGKAAGIAQFIEEQGLDRSEIMAFGDGENDIEMLKYAGIGVAMGNAGDAVKAAADYVTDSVDENGIENALKHFGLV
ncbi:MAG: Cof-type HAD-IIB family hydrolase [Stomatobaculum sp.]|nr:Cof-type HAD-IIB family hydrolase [Stomatobaculum sp.]